MKGIFVFVVLTILAGATRASADLSVPNGTETNSLTIGPTDRVCEWELLDGRLAITNSAQPFTFSATFGFSPCFTNYPEPVWTDGAFTSFFVQHSGTWPPITRFEIHGTKPNEVFQTDFITEIAVSSEQVPAIRAGGWSLFAYGDSFPNGELHGPILPRDSDGDGVLDRDDQCEGTPPGAIVDAAGCSIDQLCPCFRWLYKDQREYVEAVKREAFRFWKEGRITVAERNAIVKQAKEYNCGTPPTVLPVPKFGLSK